MWPVLCPHNPVRKTNRLDCYHHEQRQLQATALLHWWASRDSSRRVLTNLRLEELKRIAAKADYLLAVPVRDMVPLVTSRFEARRVIEPARKFRRSRCLPSTVSNWRLCKVKTLNAATLYPEIACRRRLFRQSLWSYVRASLITKNKPQIPRVMIASIARRVSVSCQYLSSHLPH